MFCTAISRNPAATSAGPRLSPVAAVIRPASSANFLSLPARRAAGPRSGRRPGGNTPAGPGRAARWRRSRSAGRRDRSRRVPAPRPRSPGRPGTCRHRSAARSRRLPRPCGWTASARAAGRRPPGSRTAARTRRRSARRRSTCRPCRTRSPGRSRPPPAVRAMPTMPPAGPERIESLPRNDAASVSPPLDCMNSTRTPASSAGHLVHVAAQHRRQVGVDDGRVAPGDKPHQRADLVRLADLGEPDRAWRSRRPAARAPGSGSRA